mmetsp:Transcript_48799/g.91369  ORF Transcript_48799/g.91369 Transcript_48799/m.91369 type:complete len:223 (+) Transcript_48799:317-985(+)
MEAVREAPVAAGALIVSDPPIVGPPSAAGGVTGVLELIIATAFATEPVELVELFLSALSSFLRASPSETCGTVNCHANPAAAAPPLACAPLSEGGGLLFRAAAFGVPVLASSLSKPAASISFANVRTSFNSDLTWEELGESRAPPSADDGAAAAGPAPEVTERMSAIKDEFWLAVRLLGSGAAATSREDPESASREALSRPVDLATFLSEACSGDLSDSDVP